MSLIISAGALPCKRKKRGEHGRFTKPASSELNHGASMGCPRVQFFLGNTAQSAFGISWKICALISSLFLEVHNTIRFAHMHKFALAKSKIWTLT